MRLRKFRYAQMKRIYKYMVKKYSLKKQYQVRYLMNVSTLKMLRNDGRVSDVFGCIAPGMQKIWIAIGDRTKRDWTLNIYATLIHELVHAAQCEKHSVVPYPGIEEDAEEVTLECVKELFPSANVVIVDYTKEGK